MTVDRVVADVGAGHHNHADLAGMVLECDPGVSWYPGTTTPAIGMFLNSPVGGTKCRHYSSVI